MKNLIIATAIGFGLAGVGGVSVAQDQTATTDMRGILVTQQPAQYETYVADLDVGYRLAAIVGNTHRQYVRAQRATDRSEALRKHGQAPQGLVSIALDNSSGPGMAKQIRLVNSEQETVAIVNVYCKRTVPSGGPHCRLDSRPMRTNAYSSELASTQVRGVQLVAAGL